MEPKTHPVPFGSLEEVSADSAVSQKARVNVWEFLFPNGDTRQGTDPIFS